MPGKKIYTVTITQNDNARRRTVHIPHSYFYLLIVLLATILSGLVGGAVHYWKLSTKVADYANIVRENKEMRMENQNYRAVAQHVREKLSFLEIISKKLAITAGLESNKAAANEKTTRPVSLTQAEPLQPQEEFRQMEETMTRLEINFRKVNEVYNEQMLLTAYTPSIWPVPGAPSRGFGANVDPWTGDFAHHSGIDIPTPYGQRVQASAAGVVVFSGYRGDYGHLVIIDHKFGLSTYYGHLMRASVRTGQTVRRHDVIGYVGSTGRSTGPHLHYEVRVNNSPVNPYKFLSDRMAKNYQETVAKRIETD